MIKYLYFFLCLNIIFLFSLNTSYSQAAKLELKTISSENGYNLVPDNVRIISSSSPGIIFNLQNKGSNYYTTSLLPGNYLLSVSKSGYSGCETYFSITGKDVKLDIYLDPLNKDPLLNSQRIKQLVKNNSTLLLGYVVDDETGVPVGSAIVKDELSQVSASTNNYGYFEFYLPSTCDKRCSADLSFSAPGYAVEKYKSFEIYPGTDFIFTIRLKKGSLKALPNLPIIGNEYDNCEGCGADQLLPDPPVSGFVLPVNIRVGRNCTGTNCTYAEVYSVETYCKYVLPAEIYSCWGNISGGMNSLQACAVAVRSYGVYYVYNPINPSLYDICDNTYCQYMGSVTSNNTNNAVDNTYRNILTNSSGVVRCEYSAENNNKGCGNGYTGTGSSWPCIYDPVCTDRTPNGHGRGLCQWGTVRWATGTLVSTSSPCSAGPPHTYGSKTWQQILTHYYNVSPYNWSVVLGTTATINSSSIVPQATTRCSTVTITNSINATSPVNLMIGASIAPAGTTNWISDPPHDIKANLSQGTGTYNRLFTIPCNAATGVYDLLTAVWYDKNNNNQIDGGDFVVHSKLTHNALSISPVGINLISSGIPKEFKLNQNYPNPFNPSTQIRFDLPKSTNVKLIIYDIRGKETAVLVSRQLEAGEYSVDWNAESYPSGTYYCRIITQEFTMTKKIVLIK